jgi:hypothetical protein
MLDEIIATGILGEGLRLTALISKYEYRGNTTPNIISNIKYIIFELLELLELLYFIYNDFVVMYSFIAEKIHIPTIILNII